MTKQKIESAEEMAIIKAVENDKYASTEQAEFHALKATLENAAHNTIKQLSKRKAISIRLLENDIARIKAKALSEGVPYQTYISHMIHKAVCDRKFQES
ncbi:hypothetical protein AGMMS50229_02360 [Campylobacterota bacterium]|nr:hypothetical protein AGMMS50229_02360 [Campylobacterota bacterium]